MAANNVEDLPRRFVPSSRSDRWFSVAVAVTGLALSILATTLTGGIMLGKISANLSNLADQQHALVDAVNGLRDATATLTAEFSRSRADIENLKNALAIERQDRLDDEHRRSPR